MKKVLLTAPILTKSGYGEHARLIYRALKSGEAESNIDLYIEPLNWGATGWLWEDDAERDEVDNYIFKASRQPDDEDYDIHIHVGILNELQPRGRKNICVTAGIETTKVSPSWIRAASLVDRIIVPSTHSKWVFDNTSYMVEGNQLTISEENKVVVHPYTTSSTESVGSFDLSGVDTEFNFLTVAQASPRKNFKSLLNGFVEQFHDNPDVGLIVKMSVRNNSIMDFYETRHFLNLHLAPYADRKCKIYLLHGDLTQGEMLSLYNNEKVSAYVTMTHGEGFGLPIFEAAQFALPVVAPRFSGHLDFLYVPQEGKKTPKFLSVDVELRHVQPEAVWPGIIERDSMWAFPNEEQYKAHLLELVNNYEKYKNQAEELRSHLQSEFSEEKVLPLLLKDLVGPKTQWQSDLESVNMVK